MAQLGEIANVKASLAKLQSSSRSGSILSASGAVRKVAGVPLNMTIILQGHRVLAEDMYTMALLMPPLVAETVRFFGSVLVDVAREVHTPNIDTRATYDSISAGPVPGGPAMIFPVGLGTGIDVGPFTTYAPLLEFGFVHVGSGEFIFNPFMVPATDIITPVFFDTMIQLAEIAQFRRTLVGPAALSPASGILSGLRGGLYSASKFIGDVQVFGFRGLSSVRGGLLVAAQSLGDVNATMRGAIGHRISRRVVGRFAGRGLHANVSTTLSGPGRKWTGTSMRIYNRISGRGFGAALRGL